MLTRLANIAQVTGITVSYLSVFLGMLVFFLFGIVRGPGGLFLAYVGMMVGFLLLIVGFVLESIAKKMEKHPRLPKPLCYNIHFSRWQAICIAAAGCAAALLAPFALDTQWTLLALLIAFVLWGTAAPTLLRRCVVTI